MFRADKSALAAALALTTQAVERRNTIPILSNVLIQRDGQTMIATASNLDIEVATRFKAEMGTSFVAFTCPASTLKDIVAKLPDGAEVTIDESDTKVTVKAGRSKFSLQTLPEADFPTMAAGDMPTQFTVNAVALSKAMKGVQFAISTEETRYYLNGIYMHAEEGALLLVATDGHRLSKRTIAADLLDNPLASFEGVIIPRATIGLILKLIEKQESVTVTLSDAKIRVAAGDTVITSKLIDGTFPEYRRVIPINNETSVRINATPMMQALERVTAISSERGRAVRMEFSPGSLRMLVSNPDAGDAEDEIVIEGDADASIGFNGKYVLEALGHVGSEVVEFMLGDAGGPTILKQLGQSADVIVVMPMRV